MSENRRSPRKQATFAIQVTNAITGEVAGRIGNLSSDGMMLVSQRPFADDALYQFTFSLPDTRGRLRTVETGLHQQWSEAANVPGQHWSGFRIIDIGPEDAAAVADWVAAAHSREG